MLVLRKRLLVAALFISIVVIALDQGGPFYFLLVSLIILLSGVEFFELMRQGGYQPLPRVGIVLIAIFLLQAYHKLNITHELFICALVVTLVIAVFQPREGWLVGWALTFVGALYVGGLGSYFIYMRDLPDGKAWGAMAALATWGMDTAAYTVGMRWGRHAFFPKISPKKTWEGAIGGFGMAVIAMLVLGTVYGLALIHALALGVGIALAGTFGDLAESVIKRQVGEDSGAMLPGHGGILDRIDSLLFVAPFVYYTRSWWGCKV
jgi:phosphatidate cytidylyltransferase